MKITTGIKKAIHLLDKLDLILDKTRSRGCPAASQHPDINNGKVEYSYCWELRVPVKRSPQKEEKHG